MFKNMGGTAPLPRLAAGLGEPQQGNAYPARRGAVSDGIPSLELAAPGDLAGTGGDLALGDVDGVRRGDDAMEGVRN